VSSPFGQIIGEGLNGYVENALPMYSMDDLSRWLAWRDVSAASGRRESQFLRVLAMPWLTELDRQSWCPVAPLMGLVRGLHALVEQPRVPWLADSPDVANANRNSRCANLAVRGPSR
jgi:hypothetical protein